MESFIKSFNHISAFRRLIICLSIASIVLISLLMMKIILLTSLLVSWNTFALMMILFSWITFSTAEQKDICQDSQKQDESRYIIFLLVVLSICISFSGIVFMMKEMDGSRLEEQFHTIISLMGVALSWALLHTIFTLRYAHLYYGPSHSMTKEYSGGLSFPEDDKPDYLDFAYFSFVIGMTFQVSDVEISSKTIRRVVLTHSIISFIFNTIIVALTISIISGLGK